MYFFTADQHYGHHNIIRYCERPFKDVSEMDEMLIYNHNSVVSVNDIVIHAGDFTLGGKEDAQNYIRRLSGRHTFLKGSHDSWLPKNAPYLWEGKIEDQYIVVCHYAMRVWSRSHYNSWQLYGHSHGRLEPQGKQWDIGVDNNAFSPVSFEDIKMYMEARPDNFNLVQPRR